MVKCGKLKLSESLKSLYNFRLWKKKKKIKATEIVVQSLERFH